MISGSILYTNLHKLMNKLVNVLEHFWCTNVPRPGLGEGTTFLLIVFSMPGHGANAQMSFCPMTPKLGVGVPVDS
jgi:hypothetical protein